MLTNNKGEFCWLIKLNDESEDDDEDDDDELNWSFNFEEAIVESSFDFFELLLFDVVLFIKLSIKKADAFSDNNILCLLYSSLVLILLIIIIIKNNWNIIIFNFVVFFSMILI